MEDQVPRIQFDVSGPGGQPGFLLIIPRDEAIDWDIQNEIASTSRYWVQEHQAWWIASYYLHTAQEIVDRFAVTIPVSVTEPSVAQKPSLKEPRFPTVLRTFRIRLEALIQRVDRRSRRLESV